MNTEPTKPRVNATVWAMGQALAADYRTFGSGDERGLLRRGFKRTDIAKHRDDAIVCAAEIQAARGDDLRGASV